MSEGQTKITGQYDVVFEGKNQQTAALIALCKKSSIANIFEQGFDIAFDGKIKGNSNYKGVVRKVTVFGAPGSEEKLKKAFDILAAYVEEGTHLSKEMAESIVNQLNLTGSYKREAFNQVAANQNSKTAGGAFVPKNQAQANLAAEIDKNDITFAIGPAGTGKTHVAMAKAVQALKSGQVKKLLLARPAMEAGEKIGYLPGDQNEKLGPYMRPLYDELDRAYGNGAYKRMIDNGTIEIVPVGYMRGRTFENAFIVVDECQNLNRIQMKMVLTRLGAGSKMVIAGDDSQSDLPHGVSGLKPAYDRLVGRLGIGATKFEQGDIVRHKTVIVVVEALGTDFDADPAPEQKASPAPAVQARARRTPTQG